MQTEAVHDDAPGLDSLPDQEVLTQLLNGQAAALRAVLPAIPAIAEGAALMARAIRGGARLIYAGAGSSALMANADGLELAGTFGIDPAQIRLCMAGGLPQDATMPGGTEDDTAQAEADAANVLAGDVVIVVTASGGTPYAVRFAERARAIGAGVIAIANNIDAAIFGVADVSICLPTPAELVAGSTRMGAGTAQKAALNMMSTLMGLRLGHIHGGMMVNLHADNEKLRARAISIVAEIAAVSDVAAAAALKRCDWDVKVSVLELAGAAEPFELLFRHGGVLRAALQSIREKTRLDQKNKTDMERTQ